MVEVEATSAIARPSVIGYRGLAHRRLAATVQAFIAMDGVIFFDDGDQ
jgi:hypothetical protein